MANYKSTENDVAKSRLFTKPGDPPGGGEEEKKEVKQVDQKLVTIMPFISSEANEGGKDFQAPKGTGSGLNSEGVVISSLMPEPKPGIKKKSNNSGGDGGPRPQEGFGAYSNMKRNELKAYASNQGIEWTNRADVTTELFKVNPKAVFKTGI